MHNTPTILRLSAIALATMTLCACGPSKTAAPPAAKTPAADKNDNPLGAVPSLNPTSVVATVNGKAITGTDLEKASQQMQMQAARRLPPEQIAQILPSIRKQAVSGLINKELLTQAVAASKITVNEDELKKAIDEVAKSAPPGQTLEGALQSAGITLKAFTDQMREQLGVQKLIEQKTKDLALTTEDDLKKYYTEHAEQFQKPESASARHILVKVEQTDDEKAKAEKKKKAEMTRERLVKGEDFTKVTAEVSEDPGSKDKGGLYEDFPRGQMVREFDAAVFSQKIGEIGPLVETQFGYHIIKVEKRTEAGLTPLADIKTQLQAYLDNQKKMEAAQNYIKGLHDTAKITYAEGFAPPPPEPATEPAPAPTK
jgi:peptidyl-prolyl cis-trans isomerase C